MSFDESISVTELNQMIGDAIKRDPRTRSLTVRGEISGFRHHLASGHWYFSLKDANTAVSCMMFRYNTGKSTIIPKDGDAVLADGYVDVYAPQGKYQLYVTSMRPAGMGEQFLRLERLKRRLAAEGLFDQSRKKVLPRCPGKVAVVTSQSGAALHDILNVSFKRCPFIPIMLVPVTVQGSQAGHEIAEGIRLAGRHGNAEVIIVARGGGAAEDLWCFNDEEIVRAIADSPVPVVSGVGHEIDYTLCDMAADVRAATPSNAAEIVFPDRLELASAARLLRSSLLRVMTEMIRDQQLKIHHLQQRLSAFSPEKRIDMLDHRRLFLKERFHSLIRTLLERQENGIVTLSDGLLHAMEGRFTQSSQKVLLLRKRMEALDPRSVMERGYAMVYSEEGKLLTSSEQAAGETDMLLHFYDGKVKVTGKGKS